MSGADPLGEGLVAPSDRAVPRHEEPSRDGYVASPVSKDALTPQLLDAVSEMWRCVTDAGGGVGFRPGAPSAQIDAAARALFELVAGGAAHLVCAHDGEVLVGWCAVVLNRDEIQSHWGWLKRMQVLPERRGTGAGKAVLAKALELCRRLDLTDIYLTTQSQSPAIEFYRRQGFTEVGRMPASLQLAPGMFDDEVYMWRSTALS